MSTQGNVDRKLAAIVFTDVVGFSALMSSDEKAAMALLEKQRRLLRPIIENFDGEWLKEIGDGLLFSFPSAVKAVTCSLEIQRILEHDPKLNIRIGIHIGDIIQKDGDVFGDGVNIASRLEPLAEPGGICVSERVYDDIRNQPEINAQFQDEQLLKGIDKPIKVYSIFTKIGEIPKETYKLPPKRIRFIKYFLFVLLLCIGNFFYYYFETVKTEKTDIEIDSKSIAVLPFDNYSNAPEDQYFSDGFTEVIIANLAKVKDLKVISRTSVMQYKSTTKPLKEIGMELGVAHILEGSVQRSGKMIRIVGQLIDTETDKHLWAETYDDEITNIFQVQSEISQKIAQSLKITISSREKELISEKSTENPEAYDLLLQANSLSYYKHKEAELAIRLLKDAIQLDSNFIDAISKLSITHSAMVHFGHDRSAETIDNAKKYYLKTFEINPNSGRALEARGIFNYWVQKNYPLALNDFNKLHEMEPGNSHVYEVIGYIQRRIGLMNESISNFKTVIDLNPNYNYIYRELYHSYMFLREYEKADMLVDKLIHHYPNYSIGYFAKGAREFRKTLDLESEANIIRDAMLVVDDREFSGYWWWYHLRNQNFDEVLRITESYPEIIYNQHSVNIKAAILSYFYQIKGDLDKAEEHFLIEYNLLKDKIKENPNDQRFYSALGRYYAKIGDLENCIKYHEKAIELFPISKDAFSGNLFVIEFTKSLGILGETEKSIKILTDLFSVNADIHWWNLKYDMFYENIRYHKDFQNLLNTEKEKATNK